MFFLKVIGERIKRLRNEIGEGLKIMNNIYERGTAISWLLNTPISDINCKNALKRATMSELKLALEELPEEGNKTKIKAIQAEINRRNK